MAAKKTKRRLTAEELADRLTDIAVAHLDTFPPKERESRIQAFEKAVATSPPRRAEVRAPRRSHLLILGRAGHVPEVGNSIQKARLVTFPYGP